MVPDSVWESLHIEDGDDMDVLVRKMRTLEEFYAGHEEYQGFEPFIHVYRKVTEDVRELHRQGRFNNPHTMEELDLYFAETYFEPMRAFFRDGERPQPWRTYLEYCTRDDFYESLAMFLGINAHINGDLLHSVNEIGLEDRDDYDRVDGILERHLSEDIHYLILKEHDRFALYAELLKPLTRYEMHSTILRWRADIWSYRGKEPGTVEPLFRDATELIAERLISIAHGTNLFTLPLQSFKLRKIRVEYSDEIKEGLRQAGT